MAPNILKPGDSHKQISEGTHRDYAGQSLPPSREREAREALARVEAERRAARAELDRPSLPPSEPPHAKIEKHGKAWGVVVAMVVGAGTVVNVGITIGKRNSEYATVGQLDKQDKKLDVLRDDVADLKGDIKSMARAISESKLTDVRPVAEQASKNALEAQAKADAAAREITIIKRGINGFNRASSARGLPTPIPLQDP